MGLLRPLKSLDEVELISSSLDREVDRIRALSDTYLQLPSNHYTLSQCDPFSKEYTAKMRRWLGEITGRYYDPSRDELSPYLAPEVLPHASDTYTPGIYRYGDGETLGDAFQAFGAIIRALDVHAGNSVLEYGPGDGQIAIALARMGCNVTVVDIEPRYLVLIAKQARALGTNICTMRGAFGDAPYGDQFDRILFYEAFHHALDHYDLVATLATQLKLEGTIVLAGEPILPLGSHYRPVLPYPWGPRLDGLSLRAMKTYGWCELGYNREYFIDLMMRNGFLVEFRPSNSTDRGSAYLAKRSGRTINMGDTFIVESAAHPNCWHLPEGTIRWTASEIAEIPVNRRSNWQSVSLRLHNHLPLTQEVVASLDGASQRVPLSPGEFREIKLPITQTEGRGIILECAVVRPIDVIPESSDARQLGVAVSSMTYSY
jgi:2-polyprenyl-3-methyl-5-hydroxy-6-metoxy-1,4-benzoquinol methylase